ncbi:MAG: ATP-grasp domain-containing protein [Rhodospirillales bacterium]
MSTIHILHENAEWTAPLIAVLEKRGLAYRDWFLAEGSVDLSEPPPDGVFYSRMSASSHTRGHVYAPELTAAVLKWLEMWGRPVLNGSRALQLEISKVAQYTALESAGIPYPRTVACVGRDAIVAAWDRFKGPVITKHNRAGKGLGVRLFHDKAALKDYTMGDAFEDSRDGVTLVQEYVRSPQPFIVRCEFIGRELFYAVRVDTSEGFELCPADSCQLADPTCMFEAGQDPKQANKFEILKDFRPPYLKRMRQVMAENDIHVAGFEFILDQAGDAYVFDINTNTNYNSAAERRAGVAAMDRLADYLGGMASETALPKAAAHPRREAVGSR